MPSHWLQVVNSDYGTITNSVTIGCIYEWKLQHGVALVEVSDSSVDYVSVVTIVSGAVNSFTRAQREVLALLLSSVHWCLHALHILAMWGHYCSLGL